MCRLLVVPEKCPQVAEHVRVFVEICHGAEHAWLDTLWVVLEEPHDKS